MNKQQWKKGDWFKIDTQRYYEAVKRRCSVKTQKFIRSLMYHQVGKTFQVRGVYFHGRLLVYEDAGFIRYVPRPNVCFSIPSSYVSRTVEPEI